LLPSALSDLLKNVADSAQQEAEDPSRASTSRSSSPAKSPFELALSSPLAEVLLDVIWAIGVEIDSRKDIANATDKSTLHSDTKGQTNQGTLDEQVKIAKIRLANVVSELIVSG